MWEQVFSTEVDGPRPLTLPELRQLQRLDLLPPVRACTGLATGCLRSCCVEARALIAEHREHGRVPFNGDGSINPRPTRVIRQPWEPKRIAPKCAA